MHVDDSLPHRIIIKKMLEDSVCTAVRQLMVNTEHFVVCIPSYRRGIPSIERKGSPPPIVFVYTNRKPVKDYTISILPVASGGTRGDMANV